MEMIARCSVFVETEVKVNVVKVNMELINYEVYEQVLLKKSNVQKLICFEK